MKDNERLPNTQEVNTVEAPNLCLMSIPLVLALADLIGRGLWLVLPRLVVGADGGAGLLIGKI